MALSIPERLDDLTPEWVTAALRDSGVLTPTTSVTSVEREILGEGAGFLGDIARLTLAYEGGEGPATVIAKLPKLANRAMGELLGAYERESCFYDEMAADLPLSTPRMYYGDFDRDETSERQEAVLQLADRTPRLLSGLTTRMGMWVAARKKRRYILLLEDIGDAEPGDQLTGVSPERCAAVLSAIAQMHAAYWNSPAVENRFWLIPLSIDARIRHGLFRTSQPAFQERSSHLIDEGFARALAWTLEHGEDAARSLQRGAPVTLVHCDLRLDNVAFRDGEPLVFDWQLVRRGPAAYDVAYFLSGACPDLTAEDEAELLHGYFAALEELGIRDYSFEALMRHYHLGLLTAMQTLTATDMMDMGEGRGVRLMEAWHERLGARVSGIDFERLLAGAPA
ncbi:MAG: phosphotransferase [Chloroflexi bacterium]|nr:phosphotransferase [Chloroflexota bacterium]